MRNRIAMFLGMSGLLFGPLLWGGDLYTFRVELDDTEPAIVGNTFTAAVFLDFADAEGEVILGYGVGLCSDDDIVALDVEGVENGATTAANELLFHQVEAEDTDDGNTALTLVGVMKIGTSLAPADDLEMWIIPYEGVAVGETTLMFCETGDLPNGAVVVLEDLTEVFEEDELAVVDLTFSVLPFFVRGDCNDDGRLDIADGIFLLRYLFRDAAEPACELACDASDDDGLRSTDAIYLFNYRFLDGPEPAPPFPDGGSPSDPGSSGSLTCDSVENCD